MSNTPNTLSYLPPATQGFYEKTALLRAKLDLVYYDLMQKRSLPEGEGSTVNFWRYAPLDIDTAALSDTDDGGLSDAVIAAVKFTTQEVSATPAMWGKAAMFTTLAMKQTIDKGMTEKMGVMGQHAAETIDYECSKIAGTNLLRRRADNNNTYQRGPITCTSAGTTTTLVSTALTEIEDFWKGGYVTIVAGPGYGETRFISGFTASSDTVTVSSAFPIASSTATKFRIVVGTGLGTSGVIDTNIARLAAMDLANQKAQKFSGGLWKGVLDPSTEHDFLSDATMLDASKYKESIKTLKDNVIGVWNGIQWERATRSYRETVAGVASLDAGAVRIVPVFGAQSCGVVNLGGGKGEKKNFEIVIRNPDQLGQALRFKWTVGWQAFFKAVSLNSCFGVGIMCGTTDQI